MEKFVADHEGCVECISKYICSSSKDRFYHKARSVRIKEHWHGCCYPSGWLRARAAMKNLHHWQKCFTNWNDPERLFIQIVELKPQSFFNILLTKLLIPLMCLFSNISFGTWKGMLPWNIRLVGLRKAKLVCAWRAEILVSRICRQISQSGCPYTLFCSLYTFFLSDRYPPRWKLENIVLHPGLLFSASNQLLEVVIHTRCCVIINET